MTIGDRIKMRRMELGLTAEELGKILGKSRATIYRYENGEIENLPTTVLEPLAKVLNTTPADLMGWEDEKEEEEITTLAAHATEDLTEEEQKKVIEFVKFIKSQRKMDEK